MSSIQVADQTFIVATPQRVAAAIAPRSRWRRWWPDLTLAVGEDRVEKGIRWTVAGALTGTMEVWLELVMDGVIVHYFLHAEPARIGGSPDRAAPDLAAPDRAAPDLAALNRRRRVEGKVMSFEVKKELEAGRPAGEPPS
ncbi:polyketide cyclase / dehydrase and lipid transport [Rhodococcus marinonascens]|uniref:polyketide cyclase / dehydrase and lipid transport n=1 Tax=Rhodococcus marinonascens TaxID=38311 RepID=UPI0009344D49|nr:polyketide cyclase / dehydrase and lipid transport [Rhodococcus marinonascens]